MLKLQYKIHILLNHKHKKVLNIFISLIILSTFKILFNNINVVECMNQQPTETNFPPILPRTENTPENIYYLALENSQLRERIALLERALRNSLELRLTERTYYDSLLRVVSTKIQELRTNLQDSNHSLAETNRLASRLFQENTTLRLGIQQEESSNNLGTGSDSEDI